MIYVISINVINIILLLLLFAAAAPDDIHLLIKYSNTLPFEDLYILQFFLKQHHNVLFILFNATQHTSSSIQT